MGEKKVEREIMKANSERKKKEKARSGGNCCRHEPACGKEAGVLFRYWYPKNIRNVI
jgi:hypothetical protein